MSWNRSVGLLLWLSSICGGADLRELTASGKLADLRWPDFSDYRAEVSAFYESSNYGLAWTNSGEPTSQAEALIELLMTADKKGLDPEDYDGSRWLSRVAHLRASRGIDTVARFDLALTVSLMRYVSDLRVGKWNPRLYCSGADIQREHLELAEFIRIRLLNASDARAPIASIEPPFAGYQRTEKALERYLAFQREDDGTALPASKKPVDPGMEYAGVARLERLLRLLGDLPQNAPECLKYDGALVDAVKHFQRRHGIEPDGRIGKTTQAELNVPLSKRVRQLQFTLERWRWVPREFSRPPIVVNIPEFELRALNEKYGTELEMKVVVGKAYGHKTPVFSAEMNEVIFRPYWNVPRSITRAELIPKIVKDRMYLARNEYEVVTQQNKVVTRGAIDDATLDQLRSGKLDVHQTPGPNNSLGLVKFLFPNSNDVYLHDTPATELFSRSRRDFSHGCIRVEKPALLAGWVLRGIGDWTPEKIEGSMKGDKTIDVRVNPPIPVLIVYATAVVLENGEVHFFDDIYGHDAALENLAVKGYPCGTWTPTIDAPVRHPHE